MHIRRSARFSRCKTYRYSLERVWETSGPKKRVVFIGLNPSTADHCMDDPTIRRCMGFAELWGYNVLTVVNLFAYRTPHPEALKRAPDPVGPYNTRHTNRAIRDAHLVIACWGAQGSWLERDRRLVEKFSDKLHCLATNTNGSPAHPLYQRSDTVPQPWTEIRQTS